VDKILLVDDSEFFIVLIKSLLDARGCNVLTATDPKEALQILKQEKPKLILLDQYMPDMTGDEFCRKVKENEDTKDIAVIMLTVSDKEEDREKCFAAGCDEFITKPICKEEFLAVISKYIQIYERKQERYPIYESMKYHLNGVEYSGHVHSVSQRGCFIMGEEMLSEDTLITLKFPISKVHDEVNVIGKVVWNFDSKKEKFPHIPESGHGMGIQFIEISEEDEEAIAKYIALGDFVV